MDLHDQRVWVTGASSGIGEALVYGLDRRGARIVLSARRKDELERVRAACQHPDRHIVVPLDLADPASLSAAAETVLADGPLDVLIHNGGLSQRSLVEDTDVAVDRRLMEVNYFGAVTLTKLVLPAMLARGRGRFVVVSSLVGHIGTPLRSGYAASKHALHGFFDALRAEVYDRGVGVTLACPGFIRTPLVRLTGDGTAKEPMDEAQRNGLSPERCAEAILQAVERERAEVLIGRREVLGVYLQRFAPALFRRVIRRVRVT